jgi:hypothetical protein
MSGMFSYVEDSTHNSTQESHYRLYSALTDNLLHKIPYMEPGRIIPGDLGGQFIDTPWTINFLAEMWGLPSYWKNILSLVSRGTSSIKNVNSFVCKCR